MTTAPPELDRELALLLRSPIGELSVRGQVVQVISRARAAAEGKQPGFGVLFVDMADDQRAWISLSLDAIQRAEAASSARAGNATRAPGRPHDEHSERERQKLAERRQTTLDQLERDLAALPNKSPWATLGLAPNSDAAEVRKAYLAMSKRYHPHVYAHLDSPEINRAATELFIAHKRAHAMLTSHRPAAPEPAGAERAPQVVPPPQVAPAPAAPAPGASLRAPSDARSEIGASAHAAETRAPDGKLQSIPPLRMSKHPTNPGAPRQARPASPVEPALPPHKRRVVDGERALTAGLKHLAACRFDEAVREIGRAAELCPERRDAAVWLHVCRARKHRAEGHDDRAQKEYRALLELDPAHREALDHLGARGDRKRPGLIGKWFGGENE